jgi:CRP/FNR family cyclic AMP-dependent transcriptional regulator
MAGAGMMSEQTGGVPAALHRRGCHQEPIMSEALYAILRHPDFPRGKVWSEEYFSPEDVILREGEASRDLYLIVGGTVRVNRQVEVDDTRSMQSGLIELTHGDTFGELNLYGQAERSASVVALSDTEVIRIDGKALSAFMDAHPELGYAVLKHYFLLHAELLRSLNIKVGGLYAAELRRLAAD